MPPTLVLWTAVIEEKVLAHRQDRSFLDRVQELRNLPLDDPTSWSNPPPLSALSAGRSAVTPVYHPYLGPLAHPSIRPICD